MVGQLVDVKSNQMRLLMTLSITSEGAMRLKIDQPDSARGRFEAKDALNPSLTFQQLKIMETKPDRCILKFGSHEPKTREYQLVLFASPFKGEVYDSSGRLVVALNSKGLMRFEEYRELQQDETTSASSLFGMPTSSSESKAYDEAGRPIDQASSDELAKTEEQAQADQAPAETGSTEVKTYAETFSTFTDRRPYGPMSVGMDIHFPNSDHVYGIPEHADSFSLKDTRPSISDPYRLYNVDIFEYELYNPMSLYGSIPFMMAQSKTVGTFGVYWLNPAETWIDIESNSSQARGAGVVDMISSLVSSDKKMTGRLTHWFSETGLIDIWLLPGPEPTTVVKYNAEIFGTIPMPPVYSTGFHQCRWNYYSEQEVMQVQDGYDQANIPLDAIWLDVEYTAGRSKKYFTWDPITFSKPIELARNLSSKGRRLIAIIDPHIKREEGYNLYDEGTSMDLWVKDPSGQQAYDGWCWPGSSVWPDYLNAQVRDWWATKFDPAHFPGDPQALVDIWNDMNEPSVFSGPEVTAPRDIRHFQGWEHRDIHNMYGFYMTKATFEGMSKYRYQNQLDRPWILTRSFFAGSQRYCAAWTGDNQANWAHLKMTVPMILSLSVAGMPFVGADVGGFFGNPESDELLVRWHQAGAFQPFFRAHAHHDARHREAYLFQGQTVDLLRNAIGLRYTYAPYWYTLFFESHMGGMPMVRPHWFHEPNDEKTYDLDDQYMLGYALLVKPVLEKGATSIDVYLPGPQTAWFDLNSQQMHQGGKTVKVAVDLSTVPLFQRAGTIIPRQYRLRRSLELLMRDPVTLDIVLGESEGKSYARGSLYVDDLKTQTPDASSASLKDIIYSDEFLYVKPSTNANLSHGLIERVVIHNWPANKSVKSILVAPNETAESVSLNFKFGQTRQDQTQVLEIRRPQVSADWHTWMLKIELNK